MSYLLHPVSQAPMYSLTWVGERHLRTKHILYRTERNTHCAVCTGESCDCKLGKKSYSHLATPHLPESKPLPPPLVTPFSPLATPPLPWPRLTPIATSHPFSHASRLLATHHLLATPHPLTYTSFSLAMPHSPYSHHTSSPLVTPHPPFPHLIPLATPHPDLDNASP
jgi:hypothetical protein